MDGKSKEDLLKRLDKTEARVVFYIVCKGMESKNLATRGDLGFGTLGIKSIERYMTSIYSKLEIGGKKNKEEVLVRDYGSLIGKLLPTIEELEKWNVFISTPSAVLESANAGKTVSATSPQPEKEPRQVKAKEKTRPRPIQTIMALVIVFLVIVISVLGIIIATLLKNGQGLSPLPTQPASQIPAVASSTAKPQQATLTSAAIVPLLAPSQTLTITSTPTYTETPTGTATPTVTPPSTVLFEDDFENGLSNQWEVISGEPLVSNGLLSTNDVLWMVVGDPSWTDLKIEINLKASTHTYCSLEPFNPRYYTALLGLRFQDIGNMIGLRLNPCGLDWYIVKKNQYELIPQGQTQGPSNTEFQTVIATIQGNKFTANVQGLVSTTFFNDLYPTGKIALRLDQEFEVDSFKIEKLP